MTSVHLKTSLPPNSFQKPVSPTSDSSPLSPRTLRFRQLFLKLFPSSNRPVLKTKDPAHYIYFPSKSSHNTPLSSPLTSPILGRRRIRKAKSSFTMSASPIDGTPDAPNLVGKSVRNFTDSDTSSKPEKSPSANKIAVKSHQSHDASIDELMQEGALLNNDDDEYNQILFDKDGKLKKYDDKDEEFNKTLEPTLSARLSSAGGSLDTKKRQEEIEKKIEEEKQEQKPVESSKELDTKSEELHKKSTDKPDESKDSTHNKSDESKGSTNNKPDESKGSTNDKKSNETSKEPENIPSLEDMINGALTDMDKQLSEESIYGYKPDFKKDDADKDQSESPLAVSKKKDNKETTKPSKKILSQVASYTSTHSNDHFNDPHPPEHILEYDSEFTAPAAAREGSHLSLTNSFKTGTSSNRDAIGTTASSVTFSRPNLAGGDSYQNTVSSLHSRDNSSGSNLSHTEVNKNYLHTLSKTMSYQSNKSELLSQVSSYKQHDDEILERQNLEQEGALVNDPYQHDPEMEETIDKVLEKVESLSVAKDSEKNASEDASGTSKDVDVSSAGASQDEKDEGKTEDIHEKELNKPEQTIEDIIDNVNNEVENEKIEEKKEKHAVSDVKNDVDLAEKDNDKGVTQHIAAIDKSPDAAKPAEDATKELDSNKSQNIAKDDLKESVQAVNQEKDTEKVDGKSANKDIEDVLDENVKGEGSSGAKDSLDTKDNDVAKFKDENKKDITVDDKKATKETSKNAIPSLKTDLLPKEEKNALVSPKSPLEKVADDILAHLDATPISFGSTPELTQEQKDSFNAEPVKSPAEVSTKATSDKSTETKEKQVKDDAEKPLQFTKKSFTTKKDHDDIDALLDTNELNLDEIKELEKLLDDDILTGHKSIKQAESSKEIKSNSVKKSIEKTPSATLLPKPENEKEASDFDNNIQQQIINDLKNEPVYIYTSLAGGGFHMIPRTNRLTTILTVNKVPFTYRDLGTDEEARKVWKRYSNGRTLPGVVRGKDDIIGNWQEMDEYAEYYEVRKRIYEMY